MLLRAGCVLVALGLAATACGSGGTSGGARDAAAAPPAGTLEALWRAPGADVGLVPGAADFAPGLVRYPFLVLRRDGTQVRRPRARVWVARGRRAKPFATGVATLERVGVPGGHENDHDVTHLYVTRFRVRAPGKYWVLAEPVGGARIQGLGTVVVKAQTASPAIGARAYPSRTPTLASARGNVSRLTTQEPPDRELLRYSVAESLAAGKPFLVAFATPKFCTSRTCGPVVDVVDAVRRRFRRSDVRFIHVEIYERNDPKLGPNRWVREWRLPSEPWVFLVGRDGRIAAKFEGSVSVRELAAALRTIA